MKRIIIISFILFNFITIFAQTSIDTLITIGNTQISSDEFLRVYNKNNNITPDEERKDMDEYLELFINYKLKVIEAEELGYDTTKAFTDEYRGYSNQLAKPYLEQNELKEELVIEAYDRYKEEIHAAHILIKSNDKDIPADTLKAYNKIAEIRARVVGGEPFEQIALATSDDPSIKENKGDLGYFSVFNMVYPFESAVYNTEVGQISEIIRSQYGYHLAKVLDRRPNRGNIKVAHVMTRIPKNASEPEKKAAEEKINKAYHALMNGSDWNDVVRDYSENHQTKGENGDIGWLKTGQAPDEFLDPCFELEIGSFTTPIRTLGGYHIGKLLDKKPIESFEEIEEKLTRKIERDPSRKTRLKVLQQTELEEKYNLVVYQENVDALAKAIARDSSIYKREWDASSVAELTSPVIKIDTKEYSQYDFAVFLNRKKILSSVSISEFADFFLKEYTSQKLREYAKEMLPVENSEYRYLLMEYHDGILLFNLTNDLVWQKAQNDTTGLEDFYKGADKYQWNERIQVNIYKYKDNSITSQLPALVKKQIKKKLGEDFLTQNICPTDTVSCIEIEEKTFEKGRDSMADKLTWEKGSYIVETDQEWNYLYYITNTKGKENKKLNEARGLYMADYQTYLEKEWIKELRAKYQITLNTELFESLK